MSRIVAGTLLAIVVACGGESHEPVTVEGSGTVIARVQGLRNSKGRVLARLYRGGEGFPSDGETAFRKVAVDIRDGVAVVTFSDVPFGSYALWICHDEDGDGKLDTNFLGIPKEGVGVSGPPPKFMPSYSDARFVHEKARTVHEIKLKYI